MMKLLPHHRIHIPNSLAIFAALLLIASSVTGFGTSQEAYSSGQEITPSANVENADSKHVSDGIEKKTRGLNLGLLLFRRG
jgi:hypothetical protein